jgi:hypothetical protein
LVSLDERVEEALNYKNELKTLMLNECTRLDGLKSDCQ